jgi:membrane associated rhomboid family serine protease
LSSIDRQLTRYVFHSLYLTPAVPLLLCESSLIQAYMNTANAIYGMLGAAFLFWFLLGLLIFLFSWEFSRPYMINILAWGLGRK